MTDLQHARHSLHGIHPFRAKPTRDLQTPKKLWAIRELATELRHLPFTANHPHLLSAEHSRLTPAPLPRAARAGAGTTRTGSAAPREPTYRPRRGQLPPRRPTSTGSRHNGACRPVLPLPPGPLTREAAATATRRRPAADAPPPRHRPLTHLPQPLPPPPPPLSDATSARTSRYR